jgi:hypothetical protein
MSFIFAPEDNEIVILNNSLYDKFKRPRETVIIEDDNNDNDDNVDDNDEPEVKLRHNIHFKKDDSEDDSDEDIAELLDNELLEAFDPATWGMEPQSPWLQHEEAAEQNTLVVPLATEPVAVPNFYIPQGVDLCFL